MLLNYTWLVNTFNMTDFCLTQYLIYEATKQVKVKKSSGFSHFQITNQVGEIYTTLVNVILAFSQRIYLHII
jgi:hypothetical protein